MQRYDTITISTRQLPDKLKELHQTPQTLFTKGNQSLMSTGKRVGIVGARKFTPYGREVTHLIAHDLARAGITIVSGLALGVDSVAHRASVEAEGTTIAVLPCGIDTVYPASHGGLAQQILDRNGLLVSEYGDKTLPMKHQFIERNRIIAALSDILIVTEAAQNSGSLHTARFALELGITIMVPPGPITSPYSAGTNQLIKSGAIPLLSSEDVLDELGVRIEDSPQYMPENEAEAAILSALQAPMTGDELLRSTELAAPILQTHLTMLEIKGVLRITSGKWQIN